MQHRTDCVCIKCAPAPKRAQPRKAPAAPREWHIREADPVRPPTCVKCIDEGGMMSPHTAEFEVRDAAGILITFACERSLPRVFARIVPIALALIMLACSDGSSSSDAGDVDAPRNDGGTWVGLIDSGELEPDAGDVDAAELEPDAGDVDAGELEPDAGDVDAGELQPDAGDVDAGELEPCADDSHRRMCHAAACSTLCRTGFNLECCDGTAGELELCACEVTP